MQADKKELLAMLRLEDWIIRDEDVTPDKVPGALYTHQVMLIPPYKRPTHLEDTICFSIATYPDHYIISKCSTDEEKSLNISVDTQIKAFDLVFRMIYCPKTITIQD